MGEWHALPLIEHAGSTSIGDAVFNEIFHTISRSLVAKCDGCLRIGGASVGADEMLALARQHAEHRPPILQKNPSQNRAIVRGTPQNGAGKLSAMTYPRSQLVPPGSPGTYHCVSRCVRRAFLCGMDRLSERSFEHRRQWVEDRLHALAELFAVAVWGIAPGILPPATFALPCAAYAVMSNHLHVVVQMLPDVATHWSDQEVAERWIRLFPRADSSAAAQALRVQVLTGNPERIAVLRSRLSDLSWLMRCLSEPIARRANQEDDCSGRFWGRLLLLQNLHTAHPCA